MSQTPNNYSHTQQSCHSYLLICVSIKSLPPPHFMGFWKAAGPTHVSHRMVGRMAFLSDKSPGFFFPHPVLRRQGNRPDQQLGSRLREVSRKKKEGRSKSRKNLRAPGSCSFAHPIDRDHKRADGDLVSSSFSLQLFQGAWIDL